MADKKDGFSHFFKIFKFLIAFRLKEYVSYRQRLIDNQYFRVNVNRYRKCQPYKHTTGICLDRLMHKVTDICKIKNILHLCINLFPGKTNHGSIKVDILNSGIFHIEACAQLQQCRNSSINLYMTTGWIQDSGNNLKNRRFSGAVGSDYANGFSSFYIKRNIMQCIMFLI